MGRRRTIPFRGGMEVLLRTLFPGESEMAQRMRTFELQRHLAEHNRRIPIIFMTAYYSEDERARAIEAGAIAFLRKPFREQDLFNAIQSTLLTNKGGTARRGCWR